MTILETLVPSIFGVAFDGPTWDAWRACLKAIFGLPMTPAELGIFRACTGRETAPLEQAREAWLAIGRRGGKSRVAALVAVYLACFRDYAGILAPGERGTLPIIAADRRQARTVMRYIVGLLDGCPMLARLVVNRTAESIELANGIVLEVHTASFRSVRGYTIVAVVLDEVAFWRSDDSANPDREIVNALRPAMATVPGALLIGISSPYARSGVLWQAFKDHHGREGDEVLCWKAATRDMNPSVPAHVVEQALAEDEPAARAEWLAEFRSDLEAFVAREVVDACTVPGRHELPPIADVAYVGFADPSGGSADSFTLAIAHAEGERLVLDVLRERKPPFSPSEVVAEYAVLLKRYRLSRVSGDRYAGEWPREQFRHHGVEYAPAERTKSDLYAALLPALNSHRVELLDLPRLHTQLVSLERRPARGGRDSIDHPSGGHDDAANAVAGAIVGALGDGGKFWGYGEHLAYLAQRAARPIPEEPVAAVPTAAPAQPVNRFDPAAGLSPAARAERERLIAARDRHIAQTEERLMRQH